MVHSPDCQPSTRLPGPRIRRRRRPPRRALVLVLVLIVVMMIALAGFSFAELMLMENKAAHLHGDALQLEQALYSGAEQLKQFCEQPREAQDAAGGAVDNPALFRAVALQGSSGRSQSANQVRFSVLTPTGAGTQQQQNPIRFGVENESGRLHLADVLRFDHDAAGGGTWALMQLPGMTEAVADSIMDWLDADSEPRPQGAENDYYAGLDEPYAARNGLPESIEELLLVKGVTREMLFGADRNYNRQLDPEERILPSGTKRPSSPAEMTPWSWLLTLYSGERNTNAAGQPRIDINDMQLSRLQQRLATAVGPQLAAFVVAYRQFGPYTGTTAVTSGPPPANATAKAQHPLRSLLDLVDAKVAVPTNAEDKTPKIYASPLTSEMQVLTQQLPKLLDAVTTTPFPVLRGRVSINHAPVNVLLAVPGMTDELAGRIVAARQANSAGEQAGRRVPTWLWTEGLVDLQKMKALLPYVSTGGDVVRAQIVARFDRPGPAARAEVIVDATSRPARILEWHDLRFHGPGYPLEWLAAERSWAGRN